MVEAFVDAKMKGAGMSVALYRVATDVGRPALIKQVSRQSRKAAEAMLETAPVVKSLLTQCFQRWRARCVGGWIIPCHCPQSTRITRASLSAIHGGRDS